MPSSPIRRLVDFAIAAEARGTKVHYLNIGQPDIHSPAEFWNAVANPGIKVLEYSHSLGISGLRTAMAKDYQKRGIPVDPADLMVTTGGSEAVVLAFLSCFDPGDEVIVVEPFYANYAGFAIVAGIKLVPITTKIEEDFALPATEEIAARLSPKTRGILLCNPSNPTGTVYSTAQLLEISKLVKERDLFLLVDEVYRDFYYGTEQLTSVFELDGLEQNAVMIDSASKKFSLCGARVGFLSSKNKEVMAAALKFGQARLASPTLDQIGVQACLENTPPTYFNAVRTEYIGRRNVLVESLRDIPGVVVPNIEGAFYAIVRLPIDSSDKFCQWLLTDFSFEGQTVLLAPASGFYITPGLGSNEVRIAYVLEQDKLRTASRVLAEALAVYPGRTVGSKTAVPA